MADAIDSPREQDDDEEEAECRQVEEAVQAGEEWKAAVLERGKQDREKMRQEEEERLRVARLQVFEDQKKAMERAKKQPALPLVFDMGAQADLREAGRPDVAVVTGMIVGGTTQEIDETTREVKLDETRATHGAQWSTFCQDKPDKTDDKQVPSDEEHLAVNPQEEGEEEEEEEAFGAMISQMTAILSRCQADADIEVAVNIVQPRQPGEVSDGEDCDEDEEDWEDGTPVSVHERIEELRLMVEESMGFERFRTAYNYVKQTRGREAGEGEDMQAERIAEVMGEGCEHLFPSLLQLIVCEQSVYPAATNR